MKLAIEMDDSKGYGHVHKAGCRDLRDGMDVGEASSRSDIGQLVEDATGWDDYAGRAYPHIAPCVRLR